MSFSIIQGDARHVPLADNSVHTVVTSPPYWGLRDYGIDGQLGLESRLDEYIANMVAVFREVWRVLRDDGTLWLNLGDSYSRDVAKGGSGPNGKHDFIPDYGKARRTMSESRGSSDGFVGRGNRDPVRVGNPNLKPKDLCGIPWRVAFALQADGWYLRSDLIWSKLNPLPESVGDRPTKSHEYIFLLAKRERYFYDAQAIAEPGELRPSGQSQHKYVSDDPLHRTKAGLLKIRDTVYPTRNARSVWTIATSPFPHAHFATFPPALVERCIKAGTSEKGCCPSCGDPWIRILKKEAAPAPIDYGGKWSQQDKQSASRRIQMNQRARREQGYDHDLSWPAAQTLGWRPSCSCPPADPVPCVAFDPFSGAGTTALVADRLGRRVIGLEMNPTYCQMARDRLCNDAPLFVGQERQPRPPAFEQRPFDTYTTEMTRRPRVVLERGMEKQEREN